MFQFIIRPASWRSSIMDNISLSWALWSARNASSNRRRATNSLRSQKYNQFYFYLESWHVTLQLFQFFYLSDLLFSFLARGISIPTCILPDTKSAIIFLYLYLLLSTIELFVLWLNLWTFIANSILLYASLSSSV